ncbi:MAG: MazG nucleotide pyrophosphohydrolase domain-containing protein [Candidatus Helarchaeota archaeon]
MQIREFQNLMRELYSKRDKRRGLSKTFLWIIEEIGELAEALRTFQDNPKDPAAKTNIAMEIADVIAWVVSLTNIIELDLEDALKKKYPLVCPKCGQNPCSCAFK